MKFITEKIKKYFSKCRNIVEEERNVEKIIESIPNVSLKEKYPNMETDELFEVLFDKRDEELSEIESDFLDSQLDIQLAKTFVRESEYGRSLAVNELILNNYKLVRDEFKNPYKESVNFILNYFIVQKISIETELILKENFPIMKNYIIRFVQNGSNDIEGHINVLEAYSEFSRFCKKILIESYPNKKKRDKEISKRFKLTEHRVRNFVDIE